MGALICLTVLAVCALAAMTAAIVLVTRAIGERDQRLLAKVAELALTHLPVGEPISIVQRRQDIEARKQEEQAKHAAFQREQIAKRQLAAAQQLDESDPEQD